MAWRTVFEGFLRGYWPSGARSTAAPRAHGPNLTSLARYQATKPPSYKAIAIHVNLTTPPLHYATTTTAPSLRQVYCSHACERRFLEFSSGIPFAHWQRAVDELNVDLQRVIEA